ncbi:hypothetical protein GKQ38_05100 [Candidatus Nanohaloarchaea archaeon]|nr:hypothetical protein GKQ38_05100 [Candidatus Nanohaloarchaea archaeon]
MVDIVGGAKELYNDFVDTATNLGSMAIFDNDENVTFEGRRDALKLGAAAGATATGGALVDSYVEDFWNENTPNVYIGSDRPSDQNSQPSGNDGGGDYQQDQGNNGASNGGDNGRNNGSGQSGSDSLTFEEQIEKELTPEQRTDTWDYLSDEDYVNSQAKGDLTTSEASYGDAPTGDSWAESNWGEIVEFYNENPDMYDPSE